MSSAGTSKSSSNSNSENEEIQLNEKRSDQISVELGLESDSQFNATNQWDDIIKMVFHTMRLNGFLRGSGGGTVSTCMDTGLGSGSGHSSTHFDAHQCGADRVTIIEPITNRLQREPSMKHDMLLPVCNDDDDDDHEGGGITNLNYTDITNVPMEVSKQITSGTETDQLRINLPTPIRSESRFPKEKHKTLMALGFATTAAVLNTVSLAIVHERLPDRKKTPPLPDVMFDLFPAQDWALDVSEVLIVVSVHAVLFLLLLHRHRFIVMRRCFLMLGVLYLMRSLSMFVTQVPVASTTYYCSPKANSTSPLVIIKRVAQLVSGFGMSFSGKQTYCGDYIFSGHTVILTTSYLVIQEYTPRRCVILHWLSWMTSVIGVLMVLLARGHYTIDVLLAYYVTTRVFYMYHTLANNSDLKTSGPTNHLSRVWWFSLFEYFEINVKDRLPRQYEWPLPWPRLSKGDRNS